MKKTVAALSLTLCACLLMFQNCGKGLKAASWAGSGAGASGTPQPTDPGPVLPGAPTFAKGDAFNYASVANKSSLLQTQVESLGYATWPGVKAIAVNAQGLGYVLRTNGVSQTVANLLAREGCFAIGGQPCALLAAGDVFEVSSADLPAAYTFTMPVPTVVSEATIPFVLPAIRGSLASGYNQATAPKVLVVSVDGAYSVAAASDSIPVTSLSEARRVALERCELTAAVTPCTVFAENSTVVFNPAAINRTPVIDYARTQLMTNLPGLKDAHFTQIVQPYLNAVDGAATRGVIYIANDGSGGMAYNPNAATAETNALNFCNANVNPGFTCFRYAIDKNVQSVAANLFALKSLPVTHCKSVPRVSCAAHKAMGCPAGSYYTMNGTTPTLENCL